MTTHRDWGGETCRQMQKETTSDLQMRQSREQGGKKRETQRLKESTFESVLVWQLGLSRPLQTPVLP